MIKNDQERFWSGDFGKEYTDRNTRQKDELNKVYQEWYGVTRVKMNETFLASLPKDTRILEVGCNTGMQLACLRTWCSSIVRPAAE